MSFNSIPVKEIIKRWKLYIRTRVSPRDIVPYIRGLTDFDLQQIEKTNDREGNQIAADRMMDAVGRRDPRSGFLSFLAALFENGYRDLAEKIIDFYPELQTPGIQKVVYSRITVIEFNILLS